MHIARFPKRPTLYSAVLAGALLSGLALSGCSKKEGPTGPAVDPNARIFITAPTKVSSFAVGDSLRIQWTIKQDPVEPMEGFNISLSPDSGANWGSLVSAAIKPELGKFAWKIASDSIYIQRLDDSLLLAGCTKCLVKLETYGSGDPFKRDTSEAFTITP